MEQRCCNVIWKRFVVDCLSASAVDDSPAVEGQDIAAVILKVKQPGKRKNPFWGAAACQYDLFPLFLDINQSLKRGR